MESVADVCGGCVLGSVRGATGMRLLPLYQLTVVSHASSQGNPWIHFLSGYTFRLVGELLALNNGLPSFD